MRVTRDDLLAVARLMHEVDRAWMRDRTAQGRPVYNKSAPRDRTPAGRAQRAAQRKAALQAQPGSIAPIGPTTPAPSDDAKESLSSA